MPQIVASLRIGLVDLLVAQEAVRDAAIALAHEIALSAPDGLRSTRATRRGTLVENVRAALAYESLAQNPQFQMADFQERVRAMTERRLPSFSGH
ncbi:MAG: hypothetical protein EOO27_19820 [Comamonadaceae bacterium]|nr:MAG: hypothetical protein EOO27_19820 [Comamonadaceae bacterium]